MDIVQPSEWHELIDRSCGVFICCCLWPVHSVYVYLPLILWAIWRMQWWCILTGSVTWFYQVLSKYLNGLSHPIFWVKWANEMYAISLNDDPLCLPCWRRRRMRVWIRGNESVLEPADALYLCALQCWSTVALVSWRRCQCDVNIEAGAHCCCGLDFLFTKWSVILFVFYMFL